MLTAAVTIAAKTIDVILHSEKCFYEHYWLLQALEPLIMAAKTISTKYTVTVVGVKAKVTGRLATFH